MIEFKVYKKRRFLPLKQVAEGCAAEDSRTGNCSVVVRVQNGQRTVHFNVINCLEFNNPLALTTLCDTVRQEFGKGYIIQIEG